MLINELKESGHKVFDSNLCDMLPGIEDIKFGIVSDNPKEQDLEPVEHTEAISHTLKVIQTIIAEEYLRPFAEDIEFLHNTIVEGVSLSADDWHSDANEKPDLFFLLYFNDMYKDGHFYIKRKDGDTIKTILPKRGTLILVENTDLNWVHRGEKSSNQRIMACFRYKVKWFD